MNAREERIYNLIHEEGNDRKGSWQRANPPVRYIEEGDKDGS